MSGFIDEGNEKGETVARDSGSGQGISQQSK